MSRLRAAPLEPELARPPGRLAPEPPRMPPPRPDGREVVGAALLALGLLALIVAIVAKLIAGPAPATTLAQPHAPAVYEGPTGRVALDGSWILAKDPHNAGLRAGWQRGDFAGQAVHVPRVANPGPLTGAAGARNYRGSIAWYRSSFTVPSERVYAIRFESVNYKATVWLDGRRLGSHLGTYLPFEYRFGAAPGTHTLVVRADWRDPRAQAAQGFHTTWFNFGGINGEVTVRPIGPSELLAPQLHTYLAGGRAVVDVSVRAHNDAAARVLQPTGSLSRPGQQIALHFQRALVAAGGGTVLRARAAIDKPALWAPGNPNLYALKLSVPGESGYVARVGLRQLTWSDGLLYLNGKRLLLRGASIQEDMRGHGDALTGSDQDQIVSELRALGANATRSQHPLDGALLDRLDAAGILVWQGVGPVDAPGNWTATTPKLMRLADRRVRITVHQAQLHPSVIAWNLANEIAGNGHRGGERRYIEGMSRQLHHLDPGRLVALDIWGPHPPHVAGPIYANVDAIGATDYQGWYETPLASPAEIVKRVRARLDHLRSVFPHKVMIVSEFGAEANRLNPTDSPGGYAFQSRLLGLHIDTYARIATLSGMYVWDLRDFAVTPTFDGGSIRSLIPAIQLVRGINQKGLIDYAGNAKPAAGVVQKAYARASGGG